MKKTKRITLIAAVLLAVFVLCGVLLNGGGQRGAIQQGNLLKNADFSVVEFGMPTGWNTGRTALWG